MKQGLLKCILFVLIGFNVSGGAWASSPAEKLVCTKSPRSDWMPEAKIREIFGEKNYSLVKFKISRGNCYEFYAVGNDGSIVEAYYHPVSGAQLRFNRVSAAPAVPAYESRTAPAAAGKP
ncbi:MAG: PepSY protein [Proteobacteria bacterium]|nr:PepSY protein [Pseudomonadota bacterium]